jgi:hypothetical protein
VKRGQGSTETLLILGAVLLLAAVVVLVASNMLSTPKAAGNVAKDKAMCVLNDTELVGYTLPYDGTNNAPAAVKWKTLQLDKQQDAVSQKDDKATEVCKLGSYSLYFDKDNKVYYLTKADNKYYKYGTGGGQGGGGGGEVTLTSTSGDLDADESTCREGAGSGNNAKSIRSTPNEKTMSMTFDFSGVRPLGADAHVMLTCTSSDSTVDITFKTSEGSLASTTESKIDITDIDTGGDGVTITLSSSDTVNICDKRSSYPPKITIE